MISSLSPIMKPLLKLALLLSVATPAGAATLTTWNTDYTGSEAHTLALYKFDSPDPLKDVSNHASNAVLTSSAVLQPTGGKFGGGVRVPTFQTTAGHNVFMDANIFSGSAMSIEFWFRPLIEGGMSGGVGYLFDKRYSTNSGVDLSLWSTGLMIFTVGNGANPAVSLRSDKDGKALTWSTSQWYHIAATYENVDGDGVLSLYRDGELLSTSTVADYGNLAAGARGWHLGNRSGSTHGTAPGDYDNFRISDVAWVYAAPVPEPSAAWLLLLPGGWILASGLRRRGGR